MRLRKNQSEASETSSGDAQVTKRRREGRGLGPFSGGQLTIIVVTLVIVVAFPFAAFAVTGSNVFVTDATSGTRAKVNSLGQQLVTGPVTVSGSVNALPTATFNWETSVARTVGTSLTWVAGGVGTTNGLVVTQINVDFWQVSATGANKQINFYKVNTSGANCSGSVGPLYTDVNPAGVGLVTVPIGPGFVVGSNQNLCALTTDGSNVNADVTVFGYRL